MGIFQRKTGVSIRQDSTDEPQRQASDSGIVIRKGDLDYVIEHGGNGSGPAWQEVSGAPVEISSPLGYDVGPITIIFLNLSKMIGTGVWICGFESGILGPWFFQRSFSFGYIP